MDDVRNIRDAALYSKRRPHFASVLSMKTYRAFVGNDAYLVDLDDVELRTFLLLVACALEG